MDIPLEIVTNFNENIQSRRIVASSKAEAHRQQLKFGEELLQQYDDLVPTFKNDPFYAALAFYGRFNIDNKQAIGSAKKKAATSEEFIALLKVAKPLRIAKEAKPVWDRLVVDFPDGAAYAVLLNMSLDSLEYPPIAILTEEEAAESSRDDEPNEEEDEESETKDE